MKKNPKNNRNRKSNKESTKPWGDSDDPEEGVYSKKIDYKSGRYEDLLEEACKEKAPEITQEQLDDKAYEREKDP